MKLSVQRFLSGLAAVVAAVTVRASDVSPTPGHPGPGLRDDVRLAYFGVRKERLLRELRRRAEIIATARACVEAANDPDQLRGCMQRQREQVEELRSENAQ